MNQMPVDVEQAGPVLLDIDEMLVPNLVKQRTRLGHLPLLKGRGRPLHHGDRPRLSTKIG
jgi:hypothetical protein